MKTWKPLYVTLCLSALACSGRAIDLDAEPGTSGGAAGAAPVDLVISRHDSDPLFGGIDVDDTRLYWITLAGAVQSCLKDHCATTRLTYTRSGQFSGQGGSRSVVASAGYVFWLGAPQGSIYSCPSSGCVAEPTRLIRDSQGTADLRSDAGYVYWHSALDVYRCAATGCGAAPELVVSGEGDGQEVQGDFLYWTNGSGIRRAPKDGSGKPTTVLGTNGAGNIAPGATHLYWDNEAQDLLRCPLAGCTGKPEVVGAGVVKSTYYREMLARPDGVYWRAGDGAEQSTVRFCSAGGCDASVAATPTPAVAFTVDTDYVYWVSPERESVDFTGTAIHRTPKPVVR